MLLDGEGRLLNAVWSGKTGPGVYERFAFDADADPRILVVGHGAAGAAIAGVFLDELPGKASQTSLPPAEAFCRTVSESVERHFIFMWYDKIPSGFLELYGHFPAKDHSLLREFQTATEAVTPWKERGPAYGVPRPPQFTHAELAKELVKEARLNSLHPVWNYLLLARVAELLEGMTSEECAEAMKQFGAFEYPPSLLPLQAVREAVFLGAAK
jgi:hypothetical protein